MGHHLRNFWRKKWPGQVRSRNYDVIRRTTSTDFHRNRVFSNVTCCHWLKWRHNAWFRSEHDHIWPVTLHLDRSKVIRGHWTWLTPYLPIVAKLMVLGFLEVLGSKTWYSISHKPVFKAHLAFQMSIRAFRQACHRAIFPVRVMLFLSGMLYIIDIWSRCQNTISFSELNVDHNGECFLSLRLIVLEIWTCKTEK